MMRETRIRSPRDRWTGNGVSLQTPHPRGFTVDAQTERALHAALPATSSEPSHVTSERTVVLSEPACQCQPKIAHYWGEPRWPDTWNESI